MENNMTFPANMPLQECKDSKLANELAKNTTEGREASV